MPISSPMDGIQQQQQCDISVSPAFARKRFDTSNVNNEQEGVPNIGIDAPSPDITPNGSIRRRRSRILAEENDLMEFLRASGQKQPNTRERKVAYGSLGNFYSRHT